MIAFDTGCDRKGCILYASKEIDMKSVRSPLLVTAAIRNIGVRKNAKKHLARMEGRYRGLLEAAPDAMVVVNQGGEIVLLNLQAEKQFGYRRDELVGQRVTNIIPEGFAERLIADNLRSADDALAQQIGTGIELIGRRKDGSEFPIELMLSPLESPEGVLVTAAIRNISVRKAAEIHLAQMELRYRGLLEAAPDAMVVVNQSGEIVLLNHQAEKQFGYRRDELVGHKVTNIIPEGFAERRVADDLRTAEDALAQQIGTGIELIGRRKDGSEFPIELMLSPLESAEGILGLVVIAAIRDITDRKATEMQLQQAQKMEAIGQLTGGVAHDFNNLLTIILGNSEILVDELKEDPPRRELAETVMAAAERGAGLTQLMLTFARRQPLAPETFDVNELVTRMGPLLQRAIGEIVEMKLELTEPLWNVTTDPRQLETALLNLVLNARDAMSQGGRLTIETSNADLSEEYAARNVDITPGRYVRLALSDTGAGIPSELLNRVFEPFFTTKEVGKGTGLGLSMVYGFVKQSGGNIKVYSEVGHGTTIKIYLPRADDRAQATIPATQSSEPILAGLESVLVVEDDPDVRTFAVQQLRRMGYTVSEAVDGPSALRKLAEGSSIELLFTDVIMPGGMTGRQLADRIKETHPEIKVLFTSGYTENSIVHHGRLDPGVTLLQKPYRIEELARKVRKVLDS